MSHSQNASGFALLPLLAIATLIAYATLELTLRSLHLERMLQDSFHFEKATAKAQQRAFREYGQRSESSPTCVLHTDSAGQEQASVTLCARLNTEQRPLISFAKLFESSAPCKREFRHPHNNWSVSGRRLTSGSLRANSVCELSGTVLLSGLHSAVLTGPRSRSNLSLYEPIEVRAQSQTPYVIASAGYIDISAPLRFSGRVVILAGGDILLQEVQTTTEHNNSLILYSLTGEVVLRSLPPNLPVEIYHRGQRVVRRGVQQELWLHQELTKTAHLKHLSLRSAWSPGR